MDAQQDEFHLNWKIKFLAPSFQPLKINIFERLSGGLFSKYRNQTIIVNAIAFQHGNLWPLTACGALRY
jgi:hypothetical protein